MKITCITGHCTDDNLFDYPHTMRGELADKDIDNIRNAQNYLSKNPGTMSINAEYFGDLEIYDEDGGECLTVIDPKLLIHSDCFYIIAFAKKLPDDYVESESLTL